MCARGFTGNAVWRSAKEHGSASVRSIEPGFPRRVVIGKRVAIGIRAIIIAHFEYKGIDRRTGEEIVADEVSVRIEDDVFIGPAAMILPDVTIVTVPWLPQVASSPVLYLH